MDSTVAHSTRLNVRSSLTAHRLMIATCAVLGSLAGVLVTGMLPITYSATAVVLIQPLEGNPYAPNAQGSDLTNLETEAQVVSSDVIAVEVGKALAEDRLPPNARKRLRINVAPNTQIVQISYSSSGGPAAEATARYYAASYLEFRTKRRDDFVDSKRQAIAERLDVLSKQLAKFRKQQRPADDSEARSVAAQQTNLRLQEAALITADGNPGEIISAPKATRSGLRIPRGFGGGAGLILGLASGVIIALLLERRSELLRTVDDIEHLGVAVLGSQDTTDPDDPDAIDDADDAPYDVAKLAGTILNRRSGTPATVAICSLSGGSSVTRFANDLANVLAQGRQSVLLIDAASELPTQVSGFSEVLSGKVQIPAALIKRVAGKPVDPVARMPVGKDPDVAFSFYSTSRMSDILDAAAAKYDWVLVHGPGSQLTAGRAVVGACRYWIPVVELGVASREDLERGLAWAQATGAEALGVVVADSPRTIFGRTKTRDPEPVGGD
ncbi:MAG: Wzz/FepE/Etk N-terminal domain-containing protein [Nocardioides sp.]